jgi:hypothetical protein
LPICSTWSSTFVCVDWSVILNPPGSLSHLYPGEKVDSEEL